ncbi:MAG: ABC transporter permease subunit, partial [Caulobacterales bacterium]|nr:ABC transporter permease subunit [Caulobacterales bacterium]
LMETLADFGVADYFAIPTFSTGIFRTWLAMGERDAALKLAGAMLVFVAALVALETLSRRGRHDDGARGSPRLDRLALSRRDAALAVLACAAPVALGFVVPMAVLLHGAITAGDAALTRGFVGFARNSVTVAVLAAALASAVALLLAYAQRNTTSRLAHGAIRASTLGYALPGALLAVGVLGPLGGADRLATALAAEHLGWSGGLLLTGAITVLVYACVVRFLTVSFNAVSGGLAQVPPAMDAAARSLGAGPAGVLRRVHLPLIRPALVSGALLVFVDVMRELPATLILRPFNFETLATRVYRLASDERLAEASAAALAIVVVGLIPVLLLNAYSRRRT